MTMRDVFVRESSDLREVTVDIKILDEPDEETSKSSNRLKKKPQWHDD